MQITHFSGPLYLPQPVFRCLPLFPDISFHNGRLRNYVRVSHLTPPTPLTNPGQAEKPDVQEIPTGGSKQNGDENGSQTTGNFPLDEKDLAPGCGRNGQQCGYD